MSETFHISIVHALCAGFMNGFMEWRKFSNSPRYKMGKTGIKLKASG